MLVHTLRCCTADERERLGGIFSVGRDQRVEADVDWLFHLFKRYQSVEFAQASLRAFVDAAEREFEVAFRDAPPSPDRDFLKALIRHLGQRTA